MSLYYLIDNTKITPVFVIDLGSAKPGESYLLAFAISIAVVQLASDHYAKWSMLT